MPERGDTIQVGDVVCRYYGDDTWRLQRDGEWGLYTGSWPTPAGLAESAEWMSKRTVYRRLARRQLTGDPGRPSGGETVRVTVHLTPESANKISDMAFGHGSRSAVVEAAVLAYRPIEDEWYDAVIDHAPERYQRAFIDHLVMASDVQSALELTFGVDGGAWYGVDARGDNPSCITEPNRGDGGGHGYGKSHGAGSGHGYGYGDGRGSGAGGGEWPWRNDEQ